MKVRMDWKTGSLVAIWFLVGVLISVIIKNWGVQDWWDATTWQIVAAIATWLLAGGVVFAILQVRQARKSTNAQLAVELFRELRSEETKENLRSIYNLRTQDAKNLTDYQKIRIDHVLDKFELLGALVKQGIIDERLAIEAFAGPPALRCWYQLAEYIKGERKKRGFFLKNYEEFTKRTFKHFKDKGIHLAFSNKYMQIEDLVKEFEKEEFKYRPGKLDEIIKREGKNIGKEEV